MGVIFYNVGPTQTTSPPVATTTTTTATTTTTPMGCAQPVDPPNGMWLPVMPMSGPVAGLYPSGQTITLQCPAVPQSTCQPTIQCQNGIWSQNPAQFGCIFCKLHATRNFGQDSVAFPNGCSVTGTTSDGINVFAKPGNLQIQCPKVSIRIPPYASFRCPNQNKWSKNLKTFSMSCTSQGTKFVALGLSAGNTPTCTVGQFSVFC